MVAAGIERYKLRKVIQKQPILIADVELFPAEEDNSQEVRGFASFLPFFRHFSLACTLVCHVCNNAAMCCGWCAGSNELSVLHGL